MTAGVPDFLAWHAGRAYAIELKAGDGLISPAQAAMLDRLSKAGVATAVCRGIDEAVACLESWKLLRGTLQ